jgi:tetratricopeptide (TPR) repeat protein
MGQPAFPPAQALIRAFSDYKAGKLVEAEQLSEQIVAANPDFFDAVYLLTIVQARLGKNDAALVSFDRALALRPSYAKVHFNRGNALQALKRYEEALASYDRAVGLQPGYALAHFNRANALEDLGRHDEALASYDRAIDLRPDSAEAHLNQALSRLMVADFDRGWPGYEWQMKVESPDNIWRDFTQPKWSGRENISGKTILLHAEQGYRDAIQFCRYDTLPIAQLAAGIRNTAGHDPIGGALPARRIGERDELGQAAGAETSPQDRPGLVN